MVQNPQSEKHWAPEHHRNWSVSCRIVRLETPGAETVESRGRKLRGIGFSLAHPQASTPSWPMPSLESSPAHTDRQAARSRELSARQLKPQEETMNRILIFTKHLYSQEIKISAWEITSYRKQNKTKTHQLCDRLRKRLMAKAPVISESPAPTHPTSS